MKLNKYVFPASLAIIGIALWVGAVSSFGANIGQANAFSNFFDNLFKSVTQPIGAPNETTKGSPTAPANSYVSSNDYESAVMKAVERVSPAVVAITISKNVPIIENCTQQSPFGNLPPDIQQFFGDNNFSFSVPCDTGKTQKQDVGGGSGFIVSADGLVLTNKHVVSDTAASYTVLTNDGKKYDAKVLARDSVQDLAVLKITGTGFPVVALGDSDSVRLGQTAITVGNSLGEFRNTVSVGVVSGLARTVTAGGAGFSEQLEGVIQSDAAINPGNSGGPLVNLRGEVIGINTAVVTGAQNIGFALPINSAKRDINSVKSTGKISVPYLGVRYVVVTPEIAKRDGLKSESGALIRGNDDGPGVVKGGPADKAGILAEDIITAVNGVTITPERSLLSLVQKYSVGDTINLKILRNGKELMMTVKLEERK